MFGDLLTQRRAGTGSVAAVVRPHARDEAGGSYVEYALLAALIALACLAAVTLFGGDVDDSLSSSGSSVANAG